MRILSILFIVCVLTSCAAPNSFQKFYNQEKKEADLALAFPKYMAMIAIPKKERSNIKYFSKGMKRIRFLYDKRVDKRLLGSFEEFAGQQGYKPYVVIKKDGTRINLFTREDEEHIREIILDVRSDEETVIVALLGKMERKRFQEALNEAREEN